ncbi:MAG: ATP-binding cassette domain-containing protein [Candidatus Bipolaricaulia bacterium]
MEAIKTENLTKRYKNVLALSDVNITVNEGEVYGFLGPNGAGKTTTIRLILDLITPTRGKAYLFGNPVEHGVKDILPKVGSVLGEPSYYPHLSGRENLELFRNLLPGDGYISVEEGLDLVDLKEKADLKFSNFSAGMRRRLALASAYIKDPDLYILDEPTNGLDPQGRVEVREMVKQLGKEGKTIFLSSHLLNEVQQVCSRVGVLKDGELIDESPVSELVEGGTGVIVTTDEDNMEKVKEVLLEFDYVESVEVNGGKAFVDCPVERSSEVLSALAGEGIEIQEIKKKKRSLEDVFIELTGEKEVDDA